MKPVVRIATRKSPLALWQAEHVAARLRETHPGLVAELLPMSTRGDKLLDAPLAKVGGKGLFVKELEHCLLNGQADIAVHSMKDVPVALPPELQIGVIMAREDPSDALVSRRFTCLDELPQNAVLGTSSLRRQCQLRARLPACRYIELRGNVNTRLAKLDGGQCDALVLASAGLKRLGLASAITEILPYELSLPAIGQGALGIEYRRDDSATDELVRPLADAATTTAITAERAMNERLQGGCQVPIAGHAEWSGTRLRLRGLVALPDGSRILRAEGYAEPARARELGIDIAERLLDQGAGAILASLGVS